MRLRKVTEPARAQRNLHGRLVIRRTDAGWIAQKWPRKRGPSTKPGDIWWRGTWGTAAQMAAKPNAFDLDFATAWTRGTVWLPRDLLTNAALGLLFEIELLDGTKMESVLTVAANPQATLDLITSTVGSMLVRTEGGWVAVPPGSGGQVLISDGLGVPLWGPITPITGVPTQSMTRIRFGTDKTNVNLVTFQVFAHWDQAQIDTDSRWNSGAPGRITFGTQDNGRVALLTATVGTNTNHNQENVNFQIRHFNSAGTLKSNSLCTHRNRDGTLGASIQHITNLIQTGDYAQVWMSVSAATNATLNAAPSYFAVTMLS